MNYNFNQRPGAHPDALNVLVVAPTGKAAFNVEGNTIHSAFQIPVQQQSRNFVPLSHDAVNSLYSAYCNVKLIIVEEFSMVGSKLFHYMNYRLQQIFKNDLIFGGISVILFGDLKQLPPVGDSWIFTPFKSNVYSELIGNPLWDRFKCFQLTEVMRQKEDIVFAEALNRLGTGELLNSDMELFQSRETDISNIPKQTIHLFATNDEVNYFNDSKINEFPGIGYESKASDKYNENVKGKHLIVLQNFVKNLHVSQTYGLPYKLKLKIGIRYMLTNNVNTIDGLVNGATGILREIKFKQITHNLKIPIQLLLDFDDERVGKNTRNSYRISNVQHTPVDLISKTFQYKKKLIPK